MIAQFPRDGESFGSEVVGSGGEHVGNLVVAIVCHELGNRDGLPTGHVGKVA